MQEQLVLPRAVLRKAQRIGKRGTNREQAMASYRGVNKVMTALEEFFKWRLPDELKQGSVNARVAPLGSADVAITGKGLGIYLQRITMDPYGRNHW